MTSRIAATPHLSLYAPGPASSDAPTPPAQEGPHQVRTRAFIQNGELATALGRTQRAPRNDAAHVLERIERELSGDAPSLPRLAELGEHLVAAAMTEGGSRALAGEQQQQALKAALERCETRLAQTPSTHADHAVVAQVRDALKAARFHQSIGQLTASLPMGAGAVADLLALTQLDPKVLAEPAEKPTHYMLFASFVRTAKYRSAELIDNLRNHGPKVGPLLKPYADTLALLGTVAQSLSALEAQCADANTKEDLRSLQDVSRELLQQLQAAGITEGPQAPSREAVPAEEAPLQPPKAGEQKLPLGQTLLNVGKKIVGQFDAYGGVAPMDDKALLALLRQPAPQLSPEQMHAFLNTRVIELTDAQHEIINNTPLPHAADQDPESARTSTFDEKFRLALANHSLTLTPEQLNALQAQPKADSTETGPLNALMNKADSQLDEAERQMLEAILHGNARGQLDAWQAHNAKLPDILEKSGLPADVRKELLSINQKMNTELGTLKNGASLISRLSASPAMLLTLAPMPLAVAFASGDKAYSSSLVAHFSKNAVFMAGLMMNELTNKRTNVEHLLNRYFVTVLSNAIVAQPTFAKNENLLHSVGFGMGAAAVSSGITLTVFNRELIMDALAMAKAKIWKKDTGNPEIPSADRQAVAEHFDRGEQMAQQVQLAVEVFKKDKSITDVLNSSLGFVAGQSSELKARFNKAEAARSGEVVSETRRPSNADFYPKMGLVVLAAGISAALVALMESLVGKADYAADALWCSSEMLKLALDPQADMQKAVQTFKDIVGLNLVMTMFLGVNKAWDFLDKGTKGFAGGAAVLTAANLTMPGMVGGAAGTLAGKALSGLTQAAKSMGTRRQIEAQAPAMELAVTANGAKTNPGGAVVAQAYQQWQAVNRSAPSSSDAKPALAS